MTTEAESAAAVAQPDPTCLSGKPDDLKAAIDKLDQALAIVKGEDSEMVHAYYGSPTVGTAEGAALALAAGGAGMVETRMAARRKFNLLKSAIDSFCAMVVEVPAIDVSTIGGSWTEQRSAEALGLFVDGVFEKSKMKALAWQCVIDCCLQRVGAIKVEVDGDNGIVVRRVLPHTIRWNPASGQDTRELFTATATPRAQLVAKYPKHALAIQKAPDHKPDDLFSDVDGVFVDVSDQVDLYEGYRTAEPGVKDSGRYVAMVGTTVLEDTKHSRKFHPIVPLRYEPSYSSWAGTPAGLTLWGYQSELDDFANAIKEACVKGSATWVMVPMESGVVEEELDNTQYRVIHHNPGKAPVRQLGVTLPPEYFQREETMIRRAFDFMGMSYDAARGVKADGVPSAKGQREVAALGQSRQLLRKEGVQDWIVEIAKTIVAVADDAYEGENDTQVTAPGGKLLRRVTWSEINYDEESFSFKCDAINALSRHPAARTEEILELVQGKILTGRQGLKLVTNKDVVAIRDSAFAVEDFAAKIIDLALGGDLRQPDPYVGAEGLQTIIDRGKERYIAELVQKKQSPNLDQLRRLIEAAKSQLAIVQKPGAAPATAVPPPDAAGAPDPADLSVAGSGLPDALPPAAAAPPVPGQGLA